MTDSNKRIRVLGITTALSGGGTDRLMYNYTKDMSDIDYDFMIIDLPEGILEKSLLDRGRRIYRVAQFRKNPIKYICDISKLIRKNRYDIVHSNWGENGLIPIFFSWLYGVKVRISHAHIAYIDETRIRRIRRHILSWLVAKLSTDLFACSEDAGKWVWCASKKPVKILKNAIEAQRYAFSPELRGQYRRDFGAEDKFVIGDVGRFSYQKNPEFTLEIFRGVLSARPEALLLFIGDGYLEQSTKALAIEMGIADKVIFAGVRKDVPQMLNMMDVFVLPTRFEGLGIVYIESQANGLPTFATAEVVPKEVGITELMHFISREKSAEFWASEILKYGIRTHSRSYIKEIAQSGYDIEKEAGALKDWYVEHNAKHKK